MTFSASATTVVKKSNKYKNRRTVGKTTSSVLMSQMSQIPEIPEIPEHHPQDNPQDNPQELREEPRPKNPVSVEHDLFNNPMIQAARKNMTPEQISFYKLLGDKMYGDLSIFDTKEGTEGVESTEEVTVEDKTEYALSAIIAGMHPKYLSAEDSTLLRTAYGDIWYEKYGYTSEDLKKQN